MAWFQTCPRCGSDETLASRSRERALCEACGFLSAAGDALPEAATGTTTDLLDLALAPTFLAHPLAAYRAEAHPRLRLHWMVDVAELSLRWAVALALAEVGGAGRVLPPKVAARIREHIERPTLGRWLMILRALTEGRPAAPRLAPGVFELSAAAFEPAFRSEADGGTAETSLLVLRNRLAHGGGLASDKAAKLLEAHRERFEALIERTVAATDELTLVGITAGQARRLRGPQPTLCPIPPGLSPEAEGTWLIGEGGMLPLTPLTSYGPVQVLGPDGAVLSSGEPSAQVYSRSKPRSLLYTPVGREEAYSERIDVESFRRLFRLDEATSTARAAPTASGFLPDDFLREARVLGEDLVGRRAELREAKQWLKGRTGRDGAAGIGWIEGGPGLGKSTLMARFASDVSNAPAHRQGVYVHRFRAGDARNSRRAFLQLLQGALLSWGPLRAVTEAP